MERTKHYSIIALLLIFCSAKLLAQYKQDIYNAYINGNMDAWKAVIDNLEQKQDKSDTLLLELINYQYGYIAFSIGNKDKKLAKKHLKLAKNNLEQLDKLASYPSHVEAYKAAFYGYSIGLNKMKAPFLGPKSIDAAKKAMKLNPSNPLGYIQYANAQFYMPPLFGGSKDEAIKYYSQAQTIMEEEPQKLKNDWNYLSLLANMAQSYAIMKQYDKADTYYQLILEVEPNFLWVKNELYPTFIKNRDNEQE